jgi:hypothetical protein
MVVVADDRRSSRKATLRECWDSGLVAVLCEEGDGEERKDAGVEDGVEDEVDDSGGQC